MANHEQMLRKLLETIAKEQNYKDAVFNIEAISSGGANYSSVLYNINVSTPNNKELHLFAKVLNFDENTRTVFKYSFIFDTENFVYGVLAENFKRIEHICEVPEKERYFFPKFYCYNPKEYEETVILENLVAQGYEVYDRLKSIDWPYASKAVKTIAKFHALAIAYEEQNPEEYNKIISEYTNKVEPAYKLMSDSFPKFVETALSVTRDENKERLQKFVDKECSAGNVLKKYCEPYRKPVLIHGDFRQSNIMHKINVDGTIDLIPVDYQTIQTASCVVDLLYFIFTGSDAQFRARYYQRLVDHYYDSLRNALLLLRLDPDKIYPRKDFDYELRENLPYGLIIAITLLPLITVEPEDAPNLNGEDLIDRMAKPKTSRHFPDRINGVIDDYVRWKIL